MKKLILYTDGGSKGNPGDAATGFVITTEEGLTLREIGEFIGTATNNVAEYSALVSGLRECNALGAEIVEVRTDSELMARQISGVYKVKSDNLKELHSEALILMKKFKKASISHIKREFNKRADELVNLAVKKRSLIDMSDENAIEIPIDISDNVSLNNQIELEF